MLKKFEIQARVMEPTSNPLQLIRELEAFESRAQQAAFTLHTICHLPIAPQNIEPYTSIVRSLCSFTTLLPTLRWYLSPAFFSSRPEAPISGTQKIQALSRRLGECEMVVQAIESASSRVLNEDWLETVEATEQQDSRVEFLPLGKEERQAAYETLEACTKDVLVALTAAQAGVRLQKSSV